MNLDVIKNFTAKREGGLRRLALDIGMSEQNLYRCIKKNNMQAGDLEKIAALLNVDIRTFFDGSVGAENNVIETKGSYSPASIHGNISIDNESKILKKENAMLHAILDEKERLIKVLLESRKS